MLKALRMDLYRMVRTKSTYIILAAMIASCAMMIWSFYVTSAAFSSGMMGETGADMNLAALMPQTIDGYFDAFFQGNFLVLFTVIFTVIFCGAEYKHGYIKNVASVISRRTGLVISKLICIFIEIIALHALTVLCIIIGCRGFLGITEVNNVRGVVLEVIWGILMNLSMASVIMLLFIIARKTTLPMVIGIIYVLMGSTIYSLADLIVEKLFKITDFSVAEYTNMGNMLSYVNSTASQSTLIRSAIVAVVYLVVSAVVSCMLMNKKDVK